MNLSSKILTQLTRKTSGGRFIPEIDGLRFVAIITVVLFHIVGNIEQKHAAYVIGNPVDYPLIGYVLTSFDRGVELFFSISGFILLLPYIQTTNNTKKPSLKAYFLRRITRLEPPYILSLILFFILNVVSGKYLFTELLPHFFASLFYIHNIIYPHIMPLVNGVTWSLEIEIQFYLIAPILSALFLIDDLKKRCLLLLSTMLFFQVTNNYYDLKPITLINYFQYFLAGIVAADLYTHKILNREKNNSIILTLIFILSLAIFYMPFETSVIKLLMPFLLVAIITGALYIRKVSALFTIPIIVVVGGMCYSIYLIHLYIIAIMSKITYLHFGLSWYVYMTIQVLIMLPVVLVLSALYYKWIEQPCMDKDWWKKTKQYIGLAK